MSTSKLPDVFSAMPYTPKGKRMRMEQLRQVTECLREAKFPRDYHKFLKFAVALRDETPEGKRIQNRWQPQAVQRGSGLPNPCPGIIFLPLLKNYFADLIAEHWTRLTAGLVSAKRKAAVSEADPAKAAALFAEAEREEALAIAKLRDELSGMAAYRLFTRGGFQAKSTPEQRKIRARRNRDSTPRAPVIRIWSIPMTQADYITATARNRKTIGRWLHQIKARPTSSSRSANEAYCYDQAVNLKILIYWIGSDALNPAEARVLAAATFAYTHIHDHDFAAKLLNALGPVLARRGLLDDEFGAQFAAHHRRYSPTAQIPAALLWGH